MRPSDCDLLTGHLDGFVASEASLQLLIRLHIELVPDAVVWIYVNRGCHGAAVPSIHCAEPSRNRSQRSPAGRFEPIELTDDALPPNWFSVEVHDYDRPDLLLFGTKRHHPAAGNDAHSGTPEAKHECAHQTMSSTKVHLIL
jgi:hypothetical protein